MEKADIQQQIQDAKHHLRANPTQLKRSFEEVKEYIRQETEEIQRLTAAGDSVIPELNYQDLANDQIRDEQIDLIKKRGCAIIRQVFPRDQVDQWNQEISDYIEQNDYLAKLETKKGLDQYFSQLQSDKPQIFGLYWSKPQMAARQAPEMAKTKRFLNRLWQQGDIPEFDPDHDYCYADRLRRREPGDKSLGLSPHMDAGSYERWVDPAFQKIYQDVFSGNWQNYNPWLASYRTQTVEYPSPAVCSMFRTFQGWTSLTPQGPKDGTLQLIPIANSITYLLLRALQNDVAMDDLCGAEPGRALRADDHWHPELMQGLISIPLVNPGDTVWWHPDIIHAVEDHHQGQGYSNVIYIGASPKCAKNEAYARKQAQSFLSGKSAPDFAAEDFEVDFKGRATLADLTDLGRQQMAL